MASRKYCFTKQVPDGTDLSDIVLNVDPLGNFRNARYWIYQLEVSPTTNKPHFQGFIYFDKPVRFSAVKKIMPDAHIEQAKGSYEDNVKYCSKSDSAIGGPWEFGEPLHQGSAKGTLHVIEMLRKGATMDEITEAEPQSVAYHFKGFEYVGRHILGPVPDWRVLKVIYIFGPAGAGKTRYAYSLDKDLYKVRKNGEWWDEYTNQKTILFDEFYGQAKISDMLEWLDGYKVALPTKGSFTQARWTQVILTSNLDPRTHLYKNVPEEIRKAFFRRISEFKEL